MHCNVQHDHGAAAFQANVALFGREAQNSAKSWPETLEFSQNLDEHRRIWSKLCWLAPNANDVLLHSIAFFSRPCVRIWLGICTPLEDLTLICLLCFRHMFHAKIAEGSGDLRRCAESRASTCKQCRSAAGICSK